MEVRGQRLWVRGTGYRSAMGGGEGHCWRSGVEGTGGKGWIPGMGCCWPVLWTGKLDQHCYHLVQTGRYFSYCTAVMKPCSLELREITFG